MNGMWFVRHGALPPNPERRIVGNRDIPLSPAGREQIRVLAHDFMPILAGRLAAVVSSDLGRCRETASILLTGNEWAASPPPIHLEPALRELNLGQWQGLTKAEIEQLFPGQYDARGRDFPHFCPEGGESFVQLQSRALEAVGRWRRHYPAGTLLVVAHAGVIRSLLACYMALPLDDVLRIPQEYACQTFVPEW
ncbi:MAG: histidine phosphatase family protein [Desulfovibrio sp.]|uniref:histidine phosphatase family protein n=1 Tax=Desulfovibrio sp. TaxID=885 RepID=UPI0039E5D67D